MSSNKETKKITKPKKKANKKVEKEPIVEDTQDSKSTKYLLIGAAVLIGIFIIFGSSIKNKENNIEPEVITKTYGECVFTKQDNVWYSTIIVKDWVKGTEKSYEIFFHYTPDEVENIPTITNIRNETVSQNMFLGAQKIYITMDPDYPGAVVLGGVEIAKILGAIYEIDVQAAIIREDNRTDAPVITCDDLSDVTKIIQLKLSDRTGIFRENGCILVEGADTTEILKASERLSFELLTIL